MDQASLQPPKKTARHNDKDEFLPDAAEDEDSYAYSDDSKSVGSETSYVYSDGLDDSSHSNSATVVPAAVKVAIAASASKEDTSPCTWNAAKAKHFMQDSIQDASELLCVPEEAAVILLRKYKWDGKRLTDDYFGDKQEQILAECGVLKRCYGSPKLKSTGCCDICFEDGLGADDLFSMNCGHEFCKECWNGYIAASLSEGQQCVYMACPHQDCNEVVTDKEVSAIAPEYVLTKFKDFQFRSFVDTNWLMRWCPGKDCGKVAVGSSDGLAGEGQCDCGTNFCLSCGDLWHVPATCEMMSFWQEKCHDESETANWILAKTKKCPKCSTRIDKNGGCNHMHCSQCGYHFCWICMQDWKIHGYDRSCNKFELDKAKDDEKKNKAERELERYLHCFNRYQNHSQAQDFAKSELEKFSQAQLEKEEEDSSFDWNALKDALRQLIECRRVLKYTYVVTYCLKDKPLQRELFEDQQTLLESFTERLSEISEKEYTSIERSELLNLTVATSRYAKAVMECDIDEGME